MAAHGCISVTSNVAPKLCAQFQNACQQGNYAAALMLQDKLVPLHKNLFLENNPAASNMPPPSSASAATSSACRWCRSARPTSAAIDGALSHAGLLPN